MEIEMVEIPAGGGCDAFLIGKYPITVGEWNAVMLDDPREGDDRHPVTRVNVDDINKFLPPLNAATSEKYRLPTEIEWCWACGKEPDNLAQNAVVAAKSIAPVGTKLPNEYGVCDMRGNIWEWMTTGRKNRKYVLRGGSWFVVIHYARAVYRVDNHPAIRYNDYGFRLCCVMRPPSR